MKIENIQRRKQDNKSLSISIRITKDMSNWLRDKNISPTALFESAVKELMENEK